MTVLDFTLSATVTFPLKMKKSDKQEQKDTENDTHTKKLLHKTTYLNVPTVAKKTKKTKKQYVHDLQDQLYPGLLMKFLSLVSTLVEL